MSAFERLHPALQHHVVNSLGWKSLRPLQEEAIDPILGGEHVILLAPTAGGKTEAALFPVLSRMLAEDWRGLSVLYVCPIKALLNNLEVRLRELTELIGRRVGLWHGDVGASARRRMLAEPPDILLTTPESIEVMLTSVRTDHHALFGRVVCVVVDEMHAFAGDDRGWHLLAVLERVARVAGRDLQRVGLSATIGNAVELLDWLGGSSTRLRRVVAPGVDAKPTQVPTEVSLDFVGSLENAAVVIARLHRGEKRLVFCDSRSRVEQLAADLRKKDVNTFVSHSSLSLDERRRAEEAFAGGIGDAVIVATSTLELGIDVGELDHVIQVDAPGSVASFLQRLGRTGRRPNTTRNCLFLATNDDAFLKCLGLLQLWDERFVEPVVPPPLPFHILAQQIMGLVLQERGIGRHTWRDWLGSLPVFAEMEVSDVEAVIDFMLASEILFEESGLLSFGVEGERSYGYRNFMELMTVFTTDPLFMVRHGRDELGFVHPMSFLLKRDGNPVLLLAGRSWEVTHTNWKEHVAFVKPSDDRGRSQWLGSGQPLHFRLCRAVRRVLSCGQIDVKLFDRARDKLEELAAGYPWLTDDGTAVVRDGDGSLRWWTFAGRQANTALAVLLGSLQRDGASVDNFSIPLVAEASAQEIDGRLTALSASLGLWQMPIEEEALEGLKFSDCLPRSLTERLIEARYADREAMHACLAEPWRFVTVGSE